MKRLPCFLARCRGGRGSQPMELGTLALGSSIAAVATTATVFLLDRYNRPRWRAAYDVTSQQQQQYQVRRRRQAPAGGVRSQEGGDPGGVALGEAQRPPAAGYYSAYYVESGSGKRVPTAPLTAQNDKSQQQQPLRISAASPRRMTIGDSGDGPPGIGRDSVRNASSGQVSNFI